MSEEQTTASEWTECTPCVKGSVFLMGVQGVKRLIADSRMSREEVEFELRADDIRYLDDKILSEAWYPVGTFDRFASIAVEARSDGDLTFLANRGEAAAARILGSQAYQGFVDVGQASRETSGPGASAATIAQLMLNFSRWQLDAESDAGRNFEIRVSEAGDLPETLRYAGQGFIQGLAAIFTGEPSSVSSERLDQDTILYRGHARASNVSLR